VSAPGDRPAIGSRAAWRTLFVTSLVTFMVSLEITIIALALPEIRVAFPDASESTLSWAITAYNIGVASLLLVAGWAADRFGRKRLFLVGIAVFGLGSLGAGLAVNAPMLIAMRALQSIGGALQFPSGLALLLPAFPPERRQAAIGVWGAMGGLAAAVGPSLGALLVDGFGWRAVFLINVPVAVFAIWRGRAWLAESRGEGVPARVDVVSVPLASLGVGAVILGIVEGGSWGWVSGGTLTAYAIGLALIAVFLVRSRRHPAPLFDLGLFRKRSFTIGNVGGIVFVVAFFGWLVLLPTYVQNVWGWSVLQTGFAIAPGPMVSVVVSPLVGRLADRIGNGPILTVGGLAGAAGMTLHLLLTGTEPSYVTGLLLPELLVGVSAGCSFAMLVGATMRDVPPRQFGMGGAGRTTIFQLSVALGIAVAVAIVGRPAGPAEALRNIQASWRLALACFLVQAAVFAFAFPRQRGHDVHPEGANAVADVG
jgi:EmrB/QacA subfamily drug resistance transporter